MARLATDARPEAGRGRPPAAGRTGEAQAWSSGTASQPSPWSRGHWRSCKALSGWWWARHDRRGCADGNACRVSTAWMWGRTMMACTIMGVQSTMPAMVEATVGMEAIERRGGGFRSPSTLRITDSSPQESVSKTATSSLNDGMLEGAKNGRADREGPSASLRASLTAFSAACDPSSRTRLVSWAYEARRQCGVSSGRSRRARTISSIRHYAGQCRPRHRDRSEGLAAARRAPVRTLYEAMRRLLAV